MAEIEIYTKPGCGYCMRAKMLLKTKNLEFTEIDLSQEPARMEEMLTRSAGYTVPQIFIDGNPIGGSDALFALERSGQLEKLLGAA